MRLKFEEIMEILKRLHLMPTVWDAHTQVEDLTFSDNGVNSVVRYSGAVTGGDRCVVTSDPFPIFMKEEAFRYPEDGFVRIAWDNPANTVPPSPRLRLSCLFYYEVTIQPVAAASTGVRLANNPDCIAVGICICPQELHHMMPGVGG